MGRVAAYLAERYADNPEVRECLTVLYHQYAAWDLKDTTFDRDFTDGRDEHFYPYLWEMILARHLHDLGLPISSADEGPDFKVNLGDQTIWIEAICPSPAGLPDHWINIRSIDQPVRLCGVPHEQMLMRWTSALKEKKEKLTGRIERNRRTGDEILKPGYLEKGIVGEGEPYVIAVSACRLGFGNAFLHEGISQMPFAVEAAFPIGPIEIVFDRETMEAVEQRNVYRPVIQKPNGADVPTDSFLNPDYAGVSAILGTPAGVNAACGDQAPIALVHNPLATNKLPVGILGVDEEYVPEDHGDHYELHCIKP